MPVSFLKQWILKGIYRTIGRSLNVEFRSLSLHIDAEVGEIVSAHSGPVRTTWEVTPSGLFFSNNQKSI